MVSDNELLSVLDDVSENMAHDWQNPADGGWSKDLPHQGGVRKSDVWTTSEVALWLAQYEAAKYQTHISDALEYLAGAQHIEDNFVEGEADGGWGWQPGRPSEPTATTLALLAFLRSSKHFAFTRPGVEYFPFDHNMGLARDWLVRHVNDDGGWSLLPGPHSSAFSTCWASIALKECVDVAGLEDPSITAAILPNALTLVENARRSGGGWGNTLSQPADAIGTAYCTYLLQYMGRAGAATNGLHWLVRVQANNGSWEPGPAQSPVEATARAVLALLSSPGTRNQPRMASAIESGLSYLLNLYIPGSGWPLQPGGQATAWTTYYACRALLARIDAKREDQGSDGLLPSRRRRRVFIVHGHHASLRADAKEIVKRQGLDPVVLEEMPNRGSMTVMEKFEHYARDGGVDFALVLLTPDDVISSEGAMGARGNAIFELGWFVAKLGRERVCILWDPTVKLPTDLDGTMRIDIRKEGWQDEVATELRTFIRWQEEAQD